MSRDLQLKQEAQKAWESRRIRKGKSTSDTVREDWVRIFEVDYLSEGEE